jgi:hypothetical protein
VVTNGFFKKQSANQKEQPKANEKIPLFLPSGKFQTNQIWAQLIGDFEDIANTVGHFMLGVDCNHVLRHYIAGCILVHHTYHT